MVLTTNVTAGVKACRVPPHDMITSLYLGAAGGQSRAFWPTCRPRP